MSDTLTDLSSALQAAHASGNIADAQKLADAISSYQPVDTSPAGIASTAQAIAPHTLGQKFMHGLGDTGLGIVEAATHISPVLPGAEALGAKYIPPPQEGGQDVSNYITNRENSWQANRTANNDTGMEWARLGGQMTAAAPLMAAMPEAEPGIMGGAINGAISGGASALMQPVGNTPEGYGPAKFQQFMQGTGLGGVTGGVLGWFGGDATKAPADKYREAVNYLRDRDVTPTIGQSIGPNAAAREDMLSTINFNVPGAQRRALQTFNSGALNEALQPLGLSYNGPAGREGMKNVADIFDKGYDAIKGQITLPVSDDLRTKIGQIVSDAATPDASIAKSTQSILDKALYAHVDENGVLTGQAFKDAEEALGKWAKRYSGENATATERGIGDALQGVQSALRDSLEDANPSVAGQLRAVNRGYAILARIQKAVPTNDPDGFVTPFSLARSVRAADNTVRDRAYTEGDSLLQKYSDAGLRVLGNKFPNSGTAGRMLSADPFAWPFQIGASVLAKPLYSATGTKLAGSAINAASQVPALMQPAAQAGQKALPYLMPGLASRLMGP